MLMRKKNVPLDYRACNQTVTVYSPDGTRRVLPGVYFDCKRSRTDEDRLAGAAVSFTLIIPGHDPIEPGDRVLGGIGPETVPPWDDALPGLGTAASVSPKFWQGTVCHMEVRG